MGKLTPKQKAFADYYIKSGNATQSAIDAGYSKKTARQIGMENLTKPYIRDYIKSRTKKSEEKRIADADEVMEFFTSVMRGDIKDRFKMDATVADRTKAAIELAKRTVDLDNGGGDGGVIIVNNIPRDG